ncbi:MAG TPA: MauE/DoxX family redox-associated membrane protein [Puia sp.]|jgi:uncharacterized membrane protein YphA (DoxX/SURF4 family)
MQPGKRKRIVGGICILYGLLLLYSGWVKLQDLAAFRTSLEDSAYLDGAARVLVRVVPVVELLAVVALVIHRLAGLIIGTGLIAVFTAYLLAVLQAGPVLACGCGGWLERLPPPVHLALNGFFILIGLLGIGMELQARRTVKIVRA